MKMKRLRAAATATIFLLGSSSSIAADVDHFGKPPPGSIQAGNFTPGGCAQVCEDLEFCTDWRTDLKNGACWLVVNRDDPRFVELLQSCPQQSFQAEIEEFDSRLLCRGED